MKLIPNANPNLVLVQVEASYSCGVYKMDIGLEVPIKHFAGGEPVGVIDLMPPEQSLQGDKTNVFEADFCDVVLKDRATGSFFPAFHRKVLQRPHQGWANEEELKEAGRRTLQVLITKATLKQRGEEQVWGYGLSRDFEAIQALYAQEQFENVEWAALCWLMGAESSICDPGEDMEVPLHEVLQYVKGHGFKVPSRLLAATQRQTAA